MRTHEDEISRLRDELRAEFLRIAEELRLGAEKILMAHGMVTA